ncbi:hemolymph lipopolysaccharide-binding protein-like [Copidosoma floridanum]|uniref:hemolymph lipopolysaccharide-binding protein-like n=1 Tax=Copidosoma floridanum TaxID=29053 RepID=UPI0006C99EBD|nr:hemolymph lipopolysaccharide-binding protein-like [Copidosoma floridanum]XP_014209584.1 hemolymph lipopolysaccharide-binding protein-like [Copidosoma floridanum]XP_014209585.1 hemolymph lipopolysaccharide-binding protein-like [Copidosoma floridanum]
MCRYKHLFALSLFISASLSQAQHTMNLNMCTNNETVALTITSNGAEGGSSCQCEVTPAQEPPSKFGYIHTPGVGSHKLHTEAKTWNEARRICLEEGANLAIINSKVEESVLVDILKRSQSIIRGGLNTEEALLGIHDLYNEGEWVTIFGDTIYNSGYYHWSPTYFGGQPDNFRGSQNCGAIINVGGMDDVDCGEKFAFFCELPIACTRS